eukprot:Clim_evm7s158 gene=Clim_evmTU7s158
MQLYRQGNNAIVTGPDDEAFDSQFAGLTVLALLAFDRPQAAFPDRDSRLPSAAADCCDSKPNCEGYDCPRNKVARPGQPSCSRSPCTDDDCCNLPPTGNCDDYTCPDGYYNLLGTCTNAQCTRSECCDEVGDCDDRECPEGLVKKEPPSPCAAAECEAGECCEQVGVCDDFECPEGFATRAESGLCAAPECEIDECCEPDNACREIECPDDLFPEPSQCTQDTCTVDDCCAARAVCDESLCGEDFYFSGEGKLCQRDPCRGNECCTRVGTCDNFECGDDATKKAGGQCAVSMCQHSECCTVTPVTTSCVGYDCGEADKKENGTCDESGCTSQSCCSTVAVTAEGQSEDSITSDPAFIVPVAIGAVILIAATAWLVVFIRRRRVNAAHSYTPSELPWSDMSFKRGGNDPGQWRNSSNFDTPSSMPSASLPTEESPYSGSHYSGVKNPLATPIAGRALPDPGPEPVYDTIAHSYEDVMPTTQPNLT